MHTYISMNVTVHIIIAVIEALEINAQNYMIIEILFEQPCIKLEAICGMLGFSNNIMTSSIP